MRGTRRSRLAPELQPTIGWSGERLPTVRKSKPAPRPQIGRNLKRSCRADSGVLSKQFVCWIPQCRGFYTGMGLSKHRQFLFANTGSGNRSRRLGREGDRQCCDETCCSQDVQRANVGSGTVEHSTNYPRSCHHSHCHRER